MSRKKTLRFIQARDNENVLEPGNKLFNSIKSNWNKYFFKNNNPIVLEIGCGKGEYTVGLAKLFPQKNFIGIDIKGDRLAVGSNYAIDNSLYNVGFLRIKVEDILNFFDENEVSEIWITFPDPQPLKSGIKKRLTNERFLKMYKTILCVNGVLHLKTDSESLFNYSLESINLFGTQKLVYTRDLYNSDLNMKHFGITTRFEEIFTKKGFHIKYLCCEFNS